MKPSSSSSLSSSGRINPRDVRSRVSPTRSQQLQQQQQQQQQQLRAAGTNDSTIAAAAPPPPPPPAITTNTSSNVRSSSVSARATARIRQRAVLSSTVTPPTVSSSATATLGNVVSRQATSSSLSNIVGRSSSSLRQRSRVGDTTSAATVTSGNTGSSSVKVAAVSTVNQPHVVERSIISSLNEQQQQQQQQSNQPRVAWIDEQPTTDQQVDILERQRRQQQQQEVVHTSIVPSSSKSRTPNSTITTRKGGLRSTLRSTLAPPSEATSSKMTVASRTQPSKVSSATATTQSTQYTKQYKIDDKYSSISGDGDGDDDYNNEEEDESSWKFVGYSGSDDNTNEGDDGFNSDNITNTNVPTSTRSTSLFTSAWNYQQQEEINFNNDNHKQLQLQQEHQQRLIPQRQDENPPPTTTLAKMKMTLMKQQQLQQQTKQKQQDIDNDRLRDSIDNTDDNKSSRIAVTTIEDLEQLMEASTLKLEPTDSSCILDNSVVMIKSYHTSTTIRLEQKLQDINSTNSKIPKVTESNVQTTSQTSQLSCTGLSLGALEELFTLTIQNHLLSKKKQNQNLTANDTLRYGDKVVLKLGRIADKRQFDQSQPVQQQEKLIVYVRQIDNDSYISNANGLILDACSDDSQAIQIDNALWTIIRFRNTHPVRIGVSATRVNKDKSKRNQNNNSNLVTPKQPIRYGEPILFRHDATGGILSCEYIRIDNENTCTKLSLVTDSYDIGRVRHTIDQSSSLLSRLQQSDLLVPSNENAFTFCPHTSPPVPSWAFTSSNSKIDNDDTLQMFMRPYLDGSYLYQEINKPQKPQLSPTIQIDDTTKYLQSCKDAVTTIRDDQMLTAKGQEFLLLDQALGTLLGLEGDNIRAVPLENSLLPIQFLLSQNKPEQQQQPPFDPIVQNIVTSIITLSTAFARVRNFVNQHFPGYEYGSIMHAMCEELDIILQEYQSSTIIQLQNEIRSSFQQGQPMALRKFLIRTSDSLQMMNVLERICTDTKIKKGGALINSLTHLKNNAFRGDSVAETMIQRLLDAASIPYMSMLIQWMETGGLDDPDAEFMVRTVSIAKSNDIHQIRAMSWESIYELAPEHVLDGYFGTTRTVEQVLTTGRYWNALRMCSDRSQGTDQKETSDKQHMYHQPTFNSGHAVVSSYVKDLYDGASSMLMNLLFDEYDLFGSLRLMKRYFLIEHGDIFVNFLDVAESELQKDLSQISRGRVQNWLNGSVQITERNTDLAEQIVSEYRTSHRLDHGSQNDGFHFRQIATISCLRCRFATSSLTEYLDELHSSTGGIDIKDPWTPLRHTYSTGKGEGSMLGNGLSGLETFFIEFADIPFPISLVLTPRAIAEYQLLFRHLFFAKHVERRLVSIWQDHQFMKELQSLRGTMGQTFLLRQRMLHFMQNLIYYMMFEVIEPNWMEMEESVMCSHMDQTVDDIVKHHDAFLRRALDACLLTNRGIVRALTKLMRTCLLFTDQMRRFLKATKIEDDRITVAGQMQKVVQRKMNDRRHSMDVEATDRASRKLLRTNIQKARMERQQRVHRQTVRVQREVSSESYQRMVHRFEEVFSDNLREFMTLLTRSDDSLHTHKVNLCIRLDYNGYVSRALT